MHISHSAIVTTALVNEHIMGYANCMDLLGKGRPGFSPLHKFQRLPGDRGAPLPGCFMKHSVQAAHRPLCSGKMGHGTVVLQFTELGVRAAQKGQKDLSTGDTLDHKIKQAPHCHVFSTRARREKGGEKVWSGLLNAHKSST